MTGDQPDIIARLQRWLPAGWFPPDSGTRVFSIISGFAAVLSAIWSILVYVANQTRMATTTDGFLDLASDDFFAGNLPRLNGELDPGFSLRIRNEVFRDRNTRKAIDQQCFDITGQHPTITELQRPDDIGCLGYTFAMGFAALGSRSDTYAVFITTAPPLSFGIPNVAGWGSYFAGLGTPQMVACDASMIVGSGFTANDLYAALNRIRTAGITYWVRFFSS